MIKIKLYETKSQGGCGKIVGEVDYLGSFRVDPLCLFDECAEYVNSLLKAGCLAKNQFLKYANGKTRYAWFISNPVKYSKPKELPNGIKAPQSWRYCAGGVILAIHKEWNEKILSGEKTVEFRSTHPSVRKLLCTF